MIAIPNLRWWIAGLLAAATALSYLDRQSLPVVIGEINKTIPVSDEQYATLQMLFLISYGLMYAGGGRIVDWLGTRSGYIVMILWWSGATILHGTARSVAALSLARFLLGLGEGGGFPASAKAVSEWFPPRERSFAFGIFNTGSSVGAVAAPPLIALLVHWWGWRSVFFVAGILGFLWAAFWFLLYDLPDRHRRITIAEREYLREHRERTGAEAGSIPWIRLFAYRQVWGLLLAKLLSDAAWYFFIFWLPRYLSDARKLRIKEIGYYAWIPYAAAGAGSFLGGWLSSHLIRRGISLDRSRKVCLAAAAALLPASLLITASPLSFALFFFSLALLGHQFWSTIMQTLAADMFPSRVVGSVAGLMGAVGSLGAAAFNKLVGHLLARYRNYAPVFFLAGILHPLSFIILLAVVRRIEMIELSPARAVGKEVA